MVMYFTEFDKLGINQTVKQFEECDKQALARSLWVSHRENIDVILAQVHSF